MPADRAITPPENHTRAFQTRSEKGAEETAPKSLRVDYRLGMDHWVSEWICLEHSGWARRKAEQWWQARSPDAVPTTAEEAVDRASAGALAAPDAITVRSIVGEKFERIIAYQLGPKPEPCAAWAKVDLDDVPF